MWGSHRPYRARALDWALSPDCAALHPGLFSFSPYGRMWEPTVYDKRANRFCQEIVPSAWKECGSRPFTTREQMILPADRTLRMGGMLQPNLFSLYGRNAGGDPLFAGAKNRLRRNTSLRR